MTTSETKKAAGKILKSYGITWERMTAKTVSFSDLARCSMVFVTAHNCANLTQENAADAALQARREGFRISFQ